MPPALCCDLYLTQIQCHREAKLKMRKIPFIFYFTFRKSASRKKKKERKKTYAQSKNKWQIRKIYLPLIAKGKELLSLIDKEDLQINMKKIHN
jgi:hypothetical protein